MIIHLIELGFIIMIALSLAWLVLQVGVMAIVGIFSGIYYGAKKVVHWANDDEEVQ